jgi:hypothetical protein
MVHPALGGRVGGHPCWMHGTCAPSARMISTPAFLARGQNVFSGWVILSEHKWVISRERRGVERIGI